MKPAVRRNTIKGRGRPKIWRRAKSKIEPPFQRRVTAPER